MQQSFREQPASGGHRFPGMSSAVMSGALMSSDSEVAGESNAAKPNHEATPEPIQDLSGTTRRKLPPHPPERRHAHSPAGHRKPLTATNSASGSEEVFSELTQPSAGSRKGPEALPGDHPVSMVRDLSRALYGMLDEFVEKNTGRPSLGFGFSSRSMPAVTTDEIVDGCSKVIQTLTKVLSIAACDPLTVRAQTHAKDLKSMLQGFRLHLSDQAFQGGVPENAVPHILEQTMMFQRMMSDHMTDLASLSYGIVIARDEE